MNALPKPKPKRIQDWIRYVQTHSETVEVSPESAVEAGTVEIGCPPQSGRADTLEAIPPARPQAKQTRQRQKPETRAQLLERLQNPTISLHEAGILLGVCAATVRRWADEEKLPHLRTPGGQRRFRFADVMALAREEKRRKTG
ncbi:MAG TPA: helix-turn-helix domain-containing protein [Abditibacteriaceae bacterium]|jgi:excisionase family DNA binding protein